MHATLFTAATLASTVMGHMYYNVTATDDNTFEPNTLEGVQEGDIVRVFFGSVSHDIVSSEFDSPCVYDDDDDAVNSGVLSDSEIFEFTVNSTDARFFFCSVGNHCQQGMALAINPSTDETVQMYQEFSTDATTDAGDESEPVGGMVYASEADLPEEHEDADHDEEDHDEDGTAPTTTPSATGADDASATGADDSGAATLGAGLAGVAAAFAGVAFVL